MLLQNSKIVRLFYSSGQLNQHLQSRHSPGWLTPDTYQLLEKSLAKRFSHFFCLLLERLRVVFNKNRKTSNKCFRTPVCTRSRGELYLHCLSFSQPRLKRTFGTAVAQSVEQMGFWFESVHVKTNAVSCADLSAASSDQSSGNLYASEISSLTWLQARRYQGNLCGPNAAEPHFQKLQSSQIE